MGCGLSKTSAPVGPNGHKEDGSYSASVTRHWKLLPSQSEARLSYLSDGTIANESSQTQLELRTLFDYPMAQPLMKKYYTEMNMVQEIEYLDCWLEIQRFKNIKFEKVLRDEAIIIY